MASDGKDADELPDVPPTGSGFGLTVPKLPAQRSVSGTSMASLAIRLSAPETWRSDSLTGTKSLHTPQVQVSPPSDGRTDDESGMDDLSTGVSAMSTSNLNLTLNSTGRISIGNITQQHRGHTASTPSVSYIATSRLGLKGAQQVEPSGSEYSMAESARGDGVMSSSSVDGGLHRLASSFEMPPYGTESKLNAVPEASVVDDDAAATGAAIAHASADASAACKFSDRFVKEYHSDGKYLGLKSHLLKNNAEFSPSTCF